MKQRLLRRGLSFVLAAVMCLSLTAPAMAASNGKGNGNGSSSSQGGGNNGKHNGADKGNSQGNGNKKGDVLTPIEDETTVQNGSMLRGQTYSLGAPDAQAEGDPTLVYFPVTMYNYDDEVYNAKVRQVEMAQYHNAGTLEDYTDKDGVKHTGFANDVNQLWSGMYFYPGHAIYPTGDTFSYDSGEGTGAAQWELVKWNEITEDGTYIVVGANRKNVLGNTEKDYSSLNASALPDDFTFGQAIPDDSAALTNAGKWTLEKDPSGSGKYALKLVDTESYLTFYYPSNYASIKLDTQPQYLTFGKTDSCTGVSDEKYHIYYTEDTMTFYMNATQTDSIGASSSDKCSKNTQHLFALYKLKESASQKDIKVESRGFDVWNEFLGEGAWQSNGNRIWSGLVESNLDAQKNIQFTKPDAGLFTNDVFPGKQVYTGVQMPFVKDDKGYYEFNAQDYGVYFHEDNAQGSTLAQNNGQLYFNKDAKQTLDGAGSDGEKTGWFPFNDGTSITKNGNADYYFGMQAAIPFNVTPDGKINEENIVFEFSGDDDVWVFIDGKLVLDLGGIHNRLDGKINFGTGKWELSATVGDEALKDANPDGKMGDYSATNADGKPIFTGRLFNEKVNEKEETGILGVDRTTFAAQNEHTLTVFYLERGNGSSNCKIRFNLPVKDSVSVTKQITQSLDENGNKSNLTEDKQAQVDKVPFTFTLFKNDEPVANATYLLLDKNGQVIGTPSTDAVGHFTLMNGQTAKFVGTVSDDPGDSYHVVEDYKDGYLTPDFTYDFKGANDAVIVSYPIGEPGGGYYSPKVTAKGGDEAEDILKFTCENYLDFNLPNPSLLATDDSLVLDYGLSVVTPSIWDNDVVYCNTHELTSVEGAQYGTVEFDKATGKITYTPTAEMKQLEVLTCTTHITGYGNDGNTQTKIEKDVTSTITIIPATNVYYEENFSNMVTYTGSWQDERTAQTDPQEGFFVEDKSTLSTRSPYGSDKAYMDDSEDSNGTSKFVNTDNASAQFSYSFTGTGTTFYARTSIGSAYMKVVVSNDSGVVKTLYRDTSFKEDTDDTHKPEDVLHNIPVFHIGDLAYDTYNVTVSIAKRNAQTEANGYGFNFWLDGIRVYNPMGLSAGDNSGFGTADSAYAAEGEKNNTVVTLREKLLSNATKDKDGNLVWSETDQEKGYFVLFTDTNGSFVEASKYVIDGPKNEVYMTEGQNIAFSIKDFDLNSQRLYLGIKAPKGAGSVSFGTGSDLEITNAPDCYYDVTDRLTVVEQDGMQTATLAVTAKSGLISLTNLRVTGKADFGIVDNQNILAYGDGSEIETPAMADSDTEEETTANLREKLLTDVTASDEAGMLVRSETDVENGNFVLFIDEDGVFLDASEFVTDAPETELSVAQGQSVTFSLCDFDPETQSVYLGVRAPEAEDGAENVLSFGGEETLTVSNTEEEYIDVTGYLVKSEDTEGEYTLTVKAESGLIALTNVRADGEAEFGVASNIPVPVEEAEEPMEPEETEPTEEPTEPEETEPAEEPTEPEETEPVEEPTEPEETEPTEESTEPQETEATVPETESETIPDETSDETM